MILTELADVARHAALDVVEVPGWRDRGHAGGDCRCAGRCQSTTPMQQPRSVTVHHTAGGAGDVPSLATVRDGRPDLAGPLAHFLIARGGTVHVVAAGLAWHTGKTREPRQGNTYSVGIEVENQGTAGDRYPAVQLDALLRLCRALMGRYDIPWSRVLGHREICSPPGRKVDPLPETLDMPAFRAALAAHSEEEPVQQQCKAEPVAGVWSASVRNAFGDVVSAAQILNGIEQRVADLQREVAEMNAKLASYDSKNEG